MSIKRESSYGNSPGIISRGSASTRGSVRYDTNPIRHLPIQLTDFSVFGYWIQWDTLIVRQMRRFSAVSELLYANVPAAVSPCDLGDGPRAQVTGTRGLVETRTQSCQYFRIADPWGNALNIRLAY
jgi:hypothetical protein